MRESAPLVCICIPTYNAEKTIRETLSSLLAQNYSNLKILVVDNASADGTLEVVQAFSDPRISVHRSEVNIGAEGNFNRCIQLAKGKYTAIYHADDIYEPQMVARQVEFLERNPAAGAVFTNARLIDDDGVAFGGLGVPRGATSADSLYDFKTIFKLVLKHSNFLICPSAMVRTDVYQKDIRGWRGDAFNTSADLDVWFRILQHHLIGILPEHLMRYRISQAQYSSNLRMRTARSDFFLVMDHYLDRKDVQALLTPQDRRHYGWLVRTDRVVRAVNLYLCGQEQEALLLCKGLPAVDALRAAIIGHRGRATLVAEAFLRLFIFLRWPALGKMFFLQMKRLAKK
jgi:glycosyltransferase involved in cell wall biosynthesis